MKFLTFPELRLEKGVAFSRKHIDRLEAGGQFPKRVKLGEARVAWVEEEIDRWCQARADERSPA